MPLRDFSCPDCHIAVDDVLLTREEAEQDYPCPLCHKSMHKVFTHPSNYTIKGDGSSTKPKGKGGSN